MQHANRKSVSPFSFAKAQSKSKTFSCKWFCLTTKYFQHSTHTHTLHTLHINTHTSIGSFCARKSPAAKVFTTRSSEQTKSNRAQQSIQIFAYVHTQLYTETCTCVYVCVWVWSVGRAIRVAHNSSNSATI